MISDKSVLEIKTRIISIGDGVSQFLAKPYFKAHNQKQYFYEN